MFPLLQDVKMFSLKAHHHESPAPFLAVHLLHVFGYSAATDANTFRFKPKHAELGLEGLYVAKLQ